MGKPYVRAVDAYNTNQLGRPNLLTDDFSGGIGAWNTVSNAGNTWTPTANTTSPYRSPNSLRYTAAIATVFGLFPGGKFVGGPIAPTARLSLMFKFSGATFNHYAFFGIRFGKNNIDYAAALGVAASVTQLQVFTTTQAVGNGATIPVALVLGQWYSMTIDFDITNLTIRQAYIGTQPVTFQIAAFGTLGAAPAQSDQIIVALNTANAATETLDVADVSLTET